MKVGEKIVSLRVTDKRGMTIKGLVTIFEERLREGVNELPKIYKIDL